MIRVRHVAACLLVAVLGASCAGDDGPAADEARLSVTGAATVTTPDGASEVVTDGTTLGFGDQFVVDEGTASLELAAGQIYEFRAGPVPSHVEVGAPPTLLAGDALISGGFPAAIRYETATLSAQGAVKVSAEVPSATAYAGRTRINGAGELAGVDGLRQVVITSSAVQEPLTYDPADEWDRRHLGEAIAFGERLEALARGYTGDLQSGTRGPDFYRTVLPPLADEREFGADLIGDRPAGETLVGAAIAIQGRSGTFRERWEAIFAFRDQGAAWGLVALGQGVSSAPVLDTIELAIEGSPLSDDPPEPTTTITAAPPPPTGPEDPTTTAPPPPTTAAPGTTAPPPPPEDGVLTPVLTPVEQILDDVLGVLGLG